MWRYANFMFVLLHLSSGYLYFRDRIPNGNNVPNPCKPQDNWAGVGHKLIGGNGARNPFGLDFANNNLTWTRTLCEKDSDMDGRSNGLELGDPNCTWTQGMSPPTGYTISHPGICDPWNDPKCLGRNQSWVMENCQPSEFECDAIKSADVQNISLRLPRTEVFAQETTYMCQIFSIPNDTDYHIIATTPIIDNADILHHAVIFGCTEDVPVSTTPFPCGMLPNRNCQNITSLWAPGSTGDCMHSSAGFRMGANGFKMIAIQLHWNNPQRRSDYFDSSGMTIYFTQNLRQYDAGILTTGQEFLLIPPDESLVQTEAIYPGDCSRRDFTGNIHVTAVLNHMHYLGVHHYLELYRNGTKVRDIATDPNYNYDNPQLHMFSSPIELRPGDELRTRCEYSSRGLSHTTQFGAATSDEMCYSFLTYYPKSNFNRDFCTSYKSIPNCRLDYDVYEGCSWRAFPDLTDPITVELYRNVTNKCSLFETCTQPCYEAVQSAKQHKCLQGDIWSRVIYNLFGSFQGVEFIMRLQSCACGVPPVAPPSGTSITAAESTCNWPDLLLPNTNHSLTLFFINVTGKCIATGPCLKECIPAVQSARQHRCFQGAEWRYGQRYLQQAQNGKAHEFLLDFESCNCQIMELPETTTSEDRSSTQRTSVASVNSDFYSLCITTIICLVSCMAQNRVV